MVRRAVLVGGAIAIVSGVGAGCGAREPAAPTPEIGKVVCPEGSSFDASRSVCVAAPPVVAQADVDAGAPQNPDDTGPAASAGSVTVTCNFTHGFVSVLPVSKYPRDDSFVMQALIGFTEDPSFWNGEKEFRPLKPYAARACGASPITIPVAEQGDYWLLVGEEGTFNARGRYDKNGVKRRITVGPQGAAFAIGRADLVHTWLCISCPWLRTYERDGSVATSFVVLANRAGRERRGTDRIPFRAPVVDGRIVARVLEREDETTSLDELVLVVRDRAGQEHVLLPRRGGVHSALASADGASVELTRGTEIAVEYELPPSFADATQVDATVVATGHYDLR